MGERWFRQEYLCEFEDAVSGVFDRDAGWSGRFTDEVKPLREFRLRTNGRWERMVFRGGGPGAEPGLHGDRGGGAGGD